MVFRIIFIIIGLFVGVYIGYILLYQPKITLVNPLGQPFHSNQVIGFLPYWELAHAKLDYGRDVTTLSYFSLTVDEDGTIKKQNSEVENEPGWNDLSTGQVTPFLDNATKNKAKLSLVVFNGNADTIQTIISKPNEHAQNLIKDVTPLLQKYKFTDLNLDIEYTAYASPSARRAFVQFVKTIKTNLAKLPDTTLTIDISPADFVTQKLIDYKAIGQLADYVVLMGYDFHAPDSYVTGPNAPLYGAGIDSEYDVKTLVDIAANNIDPDKIILGIPLYGYEWETLETNPRSAVLSGTGVIASNNRIEKLIAACSTCSVQFDDKAQESFVQYKDDDVDTYHQIFFPTEKSTQEKINYAQQTRIAGIALWSLGYEGSTLLNPIAKYIGH